MQNCPPRSQAPPGAKYPVALPLVPSKQQAEPAGMYPVRDWALGEVNDYGLIKDLQKRCLGLAQGVSKSELVRAGLHALVKMSDTELVKTLGTLEKVNRGKPSEKND